MSRWDRGWLFLLGLLATALGALVLVWDRWVDPGRRIVGQPFVGWVDEPWFPWVIAGLGLAVALVGLGWLISQLRRGRDRADRFDAGDGPVDAPVSVRARPTADAVAGQAELVAGVISAGTRVISDSPPAIELSLVVDDGADLAALTGRLDERVRSGLRRTLGRPDAALTVRIGLKHRRTGVVEGGTLVRASPPAADRAEAGSLPGATLPQLTLRRTPLPQPALPQTVLPVTSSAGAEASAGDSNGGDPAEVSGPTDHSAASSAATSSGTSTLA